MRLSAASFFDPQGAAIKPEMIPVLDAIAEELTTLNRTIRVDGHTDNSKAGPRYRDNWELSASRAAAVASYIQRAFEYPGDMLSANGHGSAKPVASNRTAAGREANRRVELVVEVNQLEPLDALGR